MSETEDEIQDPTATGATHGKPLDPEQGETAHGLPVDSDVDLHVAGQRFEYLRAPRSVLAVISAGGAIGALARWGIGTAFPAGTSGFPWATFAINVSGCLLIGVLMVLVMDVFTRQRLLRPFLGVGVLGGYTTFSTYVVDVQRLINDGRGGLALAYLGSTVIAALLAAATGIGLTRAAVRGLGRTKSGGAE